MERVQASQTSLNTSSTSTSSDVPAATHAATATLTPVDAYSVPILHFSGDSVGIQSCVPLNGVLSCSVRSRVVPQMSEQMVETVNAIPQEWISERIVDIPVASAEEQTGLQLTCSAPAPGIEYVTPSLVVECATPVHQEPFQQSIEDQTFDAPVPQVMEEQLVAVTPTPATTDDDPIPPILDDEQMLLGYQAEFDQCAHVLKTKKEVIERYEKQVAALLERVPRAVSSRERRVLQKPVDEYNALILHERQLVQTAKRKLASLVREMQEKRERAAAELLNEEMSSSPIVRKAKKGRYRLPERYRNTGPAVSFFLHADFRDTTDIVARVLSHCHRREGIDMWFQPSFIGKETSGFHDTSFRMKCDENIRKDLYFFVSSG